MQVSVLVLAVHEQEVAALAQLAHFFVLYRAAYVRLVAHVLAARLHRVHDGDNLRVVLVGVVAQREDVERVRRVHLDGLAMLRHVRFDLRAQRLLLAALDRGQPVPATRVNLRKFHHRFASVCGNSVAPVWVVVF